MSGPPAEMAEVRAAVRRALTGIDCPPGTPLLVACSGGADSMALAAATVAVAARQWPVHAAVVDHGLQDGSPERARATVELLATLDVSARVLTVAVSGTGGIEAAARRARYAALAAARPSPRSPVLLGHTLDDQAETVLLGLGRGSGARSLAGMAGYDPPWLRPLLAVRRVTTRAACAAQQLPVWDDPHNVDPRFTRVRLRTEVLPLLEEVLAGGVAAALARTAAQLAEDGAALDAMAAQARAEAEVAAPTATAATAAAAVATGDQQPVGHPELDVKALAAHPAAVRRRALRGWLVDACVPELSDALLRRADDLIERWRGQGGIALPGRLELSRRRGRLVLGRSRVSPPDRGLATTGGTGAGLSGATRRKLAVYDGDVASILVTEQQLRDKIAELGERLAEDYQARCPGNGLASDLVLVGVLKGAVMFMTDLARALPIPVQLEFMTVSSYGSATSSSGVIRILKDLDRDIAGAHVLIVEDIVDSGRTLSWLLKTLQSRHPASLEVCALLRKPDAAKSDVPVRYVGFDIPNEFVIGYGLDYAERYRDLPFIGTLDASVYA